MTDELRKEVPVESSPLTPPASHLISNNIARYQWQAGKIQHVQYAGSGTLYIDADPDLVIEDVQLHVEPPRLSQEQPDTDRSG